MHKHESLKADQVVEDGEKPVVVEGDGQTPAGLRRRNVSAICHRGQCVPRSR